MSETFPSLISIKETARRTSLNRATIWLMTRDGKFPQPVQVGKRRKAFVESEIAEFINATIDQRDELAGNS